MVVRALDGRLGQQFDGGQGEWDHDGRALTGYDKSAPKTRDGFIKGQCGYCKIVDIFIEC